MFVCSLPMKSRQRLARDVFDTFATHAGLVCDVTNTDCLTQSGNTLGCVFAAFKMPDFNVQDERLSEKLLCICFYSILIDKACDASSVQFPVKASLSLTSSSLCCLSGTGSRSVKVGHPGSRPALHQLHPPLRLRSE